MLKTEMRNPNTMHIDRMRTIEMVQAIHEENLVAAQAVGAEAEHIAAVIDAASEAMLRGGRIFYVGCGTSGRIGVMDAAECPPTFGVGYDKVVGIIAGGDKCLRKAAENEEDSAEKGIEDLKAHDPVEQDVIIGISASGSAAYVVAALEYANSIGCTTVSITSNAGSAMDRVAKLSINPDTGAEVVTGSTRMKAGTAQKLILNMISTCVMIRQGHVYENLMINLKPTNNKLRTRCIRIVSEITGLDEAASEEALAAHDWNIRSAVEAYK